MSLAARSPGSRKSLSAFDQNLGDNFNVPSAQKDFKGKKRAVASMGGEGMGLVGFQVGDEEVAKPHPRRDMRPRKSILKSLSQPSLSQQSDDTTSDYTTQQYAHTVAFGTMFGSNENGDQSSRASRQSLGGRRVSFAPNAHVRMFERPVKAPRASVGFALNSQPDTYTASSSKASHTRRSSILNIGSVSKPDPFAPSIFQGEGESMGEESMEIEEDEDGTVEFGRRDVGQPDGFGYPSAGQDMDGEGEETMEMEDSDAEDMDFENVTQQGGAILRRASMPSAHAQDHPTIQLDTADTEDEADDSMASGVSGGDEQTMDFTIAIGGLLPPQAPEGAMRNRNSIGYSVPLPEGSTARYILPGEAVEGEMDMELEEVTVLHPGMTMGMGEDDTVSSGSAGEDTMGQRMRERTMTFTLTEPPTSWASAQAAAPDSGVPAGQEEDEEDMDMDMVTSVGGIANAYTTAAYPPISPGRQSISNTRPMSGTPSFARPTVSSAQKAAASAATTSKRNVFAPSPSPFKSGNTPRKSGIQVAGEVAKRLSFGSVTGSGGAGGSAGKKRAREEEAHGVDEGEMSKRSRAEEVAEEVFGGAPIEAIAIPQMPQVVTEEPSRTPTDSPSRKILSSRRSSLGTAMRLAPAPAPSPPPEEILLEDGQDDVEELEREGELDQEEPQSISLAAFLEMTGVQFMEGLPGMTRRRSSAAKGILGQNYSGDREFALHEYTEAQVNSIFLNMYTWAANKLRDDIKSGHEELSAVEARCDEDSPPVIQEYLAATDEDRQLFEMTFKSFKTNTHLKAREMWYDWKWQLMDTIRPDVESMLEGMREDNERLSAMNEQAAALLPDLRARQAELQAELAREREVVAEIASCDQEELASYKEGIAEQNVAINGFKAELGDAKTKLAALTAKRDELSASKHESIAAIAHAKSQCDQFTRSDAIRLQEEYISIQHLHLWRPTKMLPNRLELEFDNEVALSFQCNSYEPVLRSAKMEYLTERVMEMGRRGVAARGETPTEGLFEMVKAAVEVLVKSQASSDLPSFIQRVGQLWSQAQRLRAELRYLNFHHPLSYVYDPATSSLTASAAMMVPKAKSKVLVGFQVTQGVLRGFPGSLGGMGVGVKKVYGSADERLLEEVAKQTIILSTPNACLGTFLQVCVEVEAKYVSAQYD
ncbi:hypothetical protein IAT38_008337 [Cryptococcus sp. DSM 104549]